MGLLTSMGHKAKIDLSKPNRLIVAINPKDWPGV